MPNFSFIILITREMISDDRFHYICIIIDYLNINQVNKAKFLEIKEKGKQQQINKNLNQQDGSNGCDKNCKEWSNLNYIKFHSIRRGLNLDEVNDLIKNYPGSKIQFLETPPNFFESLDNQYQSKFKELEQQVQKLQQLLEKTPNTKLSNLSINESIIIKSNQEDLAKLTDLMHENNEKENQNKLIKQFQEYFQLQESRSSDVQQLQVLIQENIKDYKKQHLVTLNNNQRDLFELILYLFAESVRLTNQNQEKLIHLQSLI